MVTFPEKYTYVNISHLGQRKLKELFLSFNLVVKAEIILMALSLVVKIFRE